MIQNVLKAKGVEGGQIEKCELIVMLFKLS